MSELERLGSSVGEALDRAESTGDFEPLLSPGLLRAARALAALLGPDDREYGELLGWLYWYRFQLLQDAPSAVEELQTALELFGQCFLKGAVLDTIPEPLLEGIADLIVAEAADRLAAASSFDEIFGAVYLWRRIVDVTPDGHPEKAARLTTLASALLLQHSVFAQHRFLDEAADSAAEAVRRASGDSPSLRPSLLVLRNVMLLRFERLHDTADLDQAIAACERLRARPPADCGDLIDDEMRFGIALSERFRLSRRTADLDEAIALYRSALDHAGERHPELASMLDCLAGDLFRRHEQTGEVADLDEAVAVGRRAVGAADEAIGSQLVSNFAHLLHHRFALYQRAEDLREAEALTERLTDGDADPSILNTRAMILRTRYDWSGSRADLDAAIGLARRAVEATSESDPGRCPRLHTLGTALGEVFRLTGSIAAYRDALDAHEEALELLPSGHADRAVHLNALAVLRFTNHERTGSPADLDAAITVSREAADAPPLDRPSRAGHLGNAALYLTARFELLGSSEDLDDALSLARAAMAARREGTVNSPLIDGILASALVSLHDTTGDPALLDEAIGRYRALLEVMMPGHPHRARILGNIAHAVLKRARETGDAADEAVTICREAVAAASDDGERARLLNLLGIALSKGSDPDPAEAVAAASEAVRLTPPEVPEATIRGTNLALALSERYRRTRDPADRDAAARSFAAAARAVAGRPSSRILAARSAADLLHDGDPATAAELLGLAVGLLPETVPHQIGRGSRQRNVQRFAGLAGDAAALALADPSSPPEARGERALQLLEAGRSVLLSQTLGTRDDLAALRELDPELAGRFVALRAILDRPAAPTGASGPDVTRSAATTAMAGLLGRIRALDGLERFGLPPRLPDLLAEAAHGPVIVCNVSRYRSDALIVHPGGVTVLELPDLTPGTLIDHVNAFYAAVRDTGSDRIAVRLRAQTRLREILGWLWETVTGPVLRTLEAGTRVWWVPGGVLGLLPLHAAGPADAPGVLDLVVSSYSPTVAALSRARRRAARAGSGRALVVAMPVTPGFADGSLPHAGTEAAEVAAAMPGTVLLGTVATREAVLALLDGCSVAHFACHAVNDLADPSRSKLLLQDHATAPLDVAALNDLDLAHARLAYLSACTTAVTRTDQLHDEAIHLASAFLLAGFPQVVGTLWPIADETALAVARGFYGRAAGTGEDAARSLHEAMLAVRDRAPAAPSLWAAFLHIGA
ncbi:CHAT domain-containing protein [Sphaerisporangium sp. NPDC005288]|uniref:CHAT domain-containing protein n=1 Tax=Sphaerisporangium sp. NPDC005288 TaxID=3155114 RepID=UPI0033B9DCE4